MTKDELNKNYNVLYDWRNLMTDIKTVRFEDSPFGPTEVIYWTVYKYDEAGSRVRKTTYKYTGSEPDPVYEDGGDNPLWQLYSNEFYVRDAAGKEIAIYSGSSLQYWNMWGLDNVGKINSDTTRNYYLKDHLGSVRAVLNSTNTVISAQDYDAWGYVLQSRSYNLNAMKYDYTGKERDNETNYDYFGARYYDSRIGRWGQVDPKMSREPGWTPYRGFLDNPINVVDPDGEIELPSEYKDKYPKLYSFVKNDLEKQVTSDPVKMDALVKNTGLSEETIKQNLKWGEGPLLIVTQLGKLWGQEHQGHAEPTYNMAYIDEDVVLEFESSEGEAFDVNKVIVESLSLHEFVHIGYYYGQTNVDKSKLAYPSEVGRSFETDAYGRWIDTYDNAVDYLNDVNAKKGISKRYEKQIQN